MLLAIINGSKDGKSNRSSIEMHKDNSIAAVS